MDEKSKKIKIKILYSKIMGRNWGCLLKKTISFTRLSQIAFANE